jgi:hypothetical protein
MELVATRRLLAQPEHQPRGRRRIDALRTSTSDLVATGRLLYPPGAAEVGTSRRPDFARPVELSVARRPAAVRPERCCSIEATLAAGHLVDHSSIAIAKLECDDPATRGRR